MMTTRTRPHRHLSLSARMNGQYWRIARRRRILLKIFQIFWDDLTIYPLQLEQAMAFLVALRRAVEHAYRFYEMLDEDDMKLVQPWGTVTKLADFESQVTELLLYIVALQEATAQEQIFIRVPLHVVIRQLFASGLPSFEDLTSQLGALLEKVREGVEKPCSPLIQGEQA